jgi:hypothetical protein
MLTNLPVQGRGKWMVPAYQCILFTSFGCSMYMMGRLVLVRYLATLHCAIVAVTDSSRGTRRGSARTRQFARRASE